MTEPSTLASALNQAHHEILAADDRTVVMGEDVAENGGVFRITEGLLEEYGSDRVIDTPLAEAGIVGTAFGMATHGMRPIAEIQFSGFLHPAMDQIVSHVARIRTRSRGNYTCPLVLRAPYTGGIKAPEHHSESLEALYVHVPGLKVVTPARPVDARNLLHGAVRDPDPVLFLEPKNVYRSVKETLPEDPEPVPPGEARVVDEGSDLTVLSWGAMLRMCARYLKESDRDASVELIDLRSLYPIDEETVVESVRKTGRAVVVQEAPRTAGLAGEITTLINEEAFLILEAPVKRVTGFDTVVPLARLEEQYRPGPERLDEAIEETLNF